MSRLPGRCTRLISIEPDLVDDYGHHLRFNERLSEACANAGIEFVVLAGKDCDPKIVERHPFVRPTFSLRTWDPGTLPFTPLAKWRFGLELWRALANVVPSSQAGLSALFMYSAGLGHGQMIKQAIRWSGDREITATLHFFRVHFDNPLRTRFVGKWTSLVKEMVSGSQIRLVLPTPQSAERFAASFGSKPSVLSHPSPAFSDARARELSALPRPVRDGPTRIVFPGGVRVEKGFQLAAEAAIRLAEKRRFECVVRAIRRENVPEELEGTLAQLRASRCTISDQTLNSEDFDAFIAAADVLVLPYAASHFHERTSGLLVDAIILGVPVVAGKGTWLGDLIDQEGCGVSVPLNNPVSLIDGICQVVDNLEKFRVQTAAARTRYLENHSWGKLLGDLVGAT